MVDLGQKKVELSTFFYLSKFCTKKLPEKFPAAKQIKNLCAGYSLCCAYLFATSSQLITLKKASI